MTISTKYTTRVLLLVNILLVICIVFLVVYIKENKNNNFGKISHEKGGQYIFTNPILDFELDQSYKNTSISRSETENLIDELKESYGTKFISLYYRDLNNGPWIGFKEKEYFSPASMLKTPLMIAFFKYAETYPEIFSKKVLVTKEDFINVSNQYKKETNIVQAGTSYTMIELVEYMIKSSDNTAARLIQKNIPQSYIDDTYKQIGVPLLSDNADNLIRVKDMASFFRTLYNASYLNRQYSEQALKILSESTYSDGIVAGVPKDIFVAHKFGERIPEGVLLENEILLSGDIQLHECGIIYYPHKPYILCVMTRGSSYENQQKVISTVSEFFYQKVKESI